MKLSFFRLANWAGLAFLMCSSFSLWAQEAAAKAASAEPELQSKETLMTLLFKGGPVMVPLAICSIIALTVSIERFISLGRDRVIPNNFLKSLRKAQENPDSPDLNKAYEYCETKSSVLGKIIRLGIDKWKLGKSKEDIQKSVEDYSARLIGGMQRSLRVLKVIATVSPLLGLLGTVFGMIRAFQTVALSTDSFGKAEKLAHGIYEAMVTTAAGLTIAIPVMVVYYYFYIRVDRYADDIEIVCDQFEEEFLKFDQSGEQKK